MEPHPQSAVSLAAQPVLTLTRQAVERVKETMAAGDQLGHVLRVGVVPGGCSGFQYDLDLVREARPGDVTFEQDGVKLAIDPARAQVLAGTVIDFHDDGLRAGFSFTNPNATNTCGCGTSFQA
jgi:iron-sulfur cluster assembly accessory protein